MKSTKIIKNCLLCAQPLCAKACKKLNLEEILLNVWFANEKYAASILPKVNPCLKCSKPCSKSCILDDKIDFASLIKHLYEIKKDCKTVKLDLSKLEINFFGKKMENPFLLSSSIVGSTYEKCARAFDYGWAGVALKTITNIKISETSPRYEASQTRFGTFEIFKNIEQLSEQTVEENILMIKKLKKNYPNKIILASLMGETEKDWIELSKKLEKAGADCLELNFSCPNMEKHNTGSDVGQIPELVYKYTKAVKKAVKIPVLAKLTPNVANMSDAAEAAVKGGADGVAAINTIKSLIIPPTKQGVGKLAIGGLSGNAVKPIALRFINEIKQNPKTKKLYISGMGGIENYIDCINFISLGCESIQITTAIMQYGLRIIKPLITGLAYYLQTHNYKNVSELVGIKLKDIVPLDKCERDIINYPCFDRKKCIGCGRCVISCRDGGHEALSFNEQRMPMLNAKKCAGCHLCVKVCQQDAINPAKVTIKKH